MDTSSTSGSRTKPALFEYAYIRKIEDTLRELASLAMNESWEYHHTPFDKPLPILYSYLLHTFHRIKDEQKILEIERYSCFNTGLVTENQQEIFMLFKKGERGWYFVEFCKESDGNMSRFSNLPEQAQYFTDPSELIFDDRLPLRLNIDHIIEDQDNFERFPEMIKSLPKLQLVNTFNGAIQHANKRVKRSYKTAIPQFYRGYNVPHGQIQLLIPLCLTDPTKADLALAVCKEDGFYSGRTCLTLDMAINNARLIAKPDDEWLRP